LAKQINGPSAPDTHGTVCIAAQNEIGQPYPGNYPAGVENEEKETTGNP
jgi:hypothetical protein